MYFQFSLIAAHLNPSDSEEWVRLAEMSLEADNVRQAISCYDKGRKDTRYSFYGLSRVRMQLGIPGIYWNLKNFDSKPWKALKFGHPKIILAFGKLGIGICFHKFLSICLSINNSSKSLFFQQFSIEWFE